jgi:hypothetical protein
VEQLDVPARFDLTRNEERVSAARRGGALVSFAVRTLHAVGGRVPAHPFGTISAAGFESPLGKAGEFFFEELAPGDYRARVESPAGSCVVALHVPAVRTVAQVGDLGCEEQP